MTDLINNLNNATLALNAAHQVKARRGKSYKEEKREADSMEQPPMADQGLKLPPLPENSNIHIYVDQDRDKDRDGNPDEHHHGKPRAHFSMRAIWAWGAGIVSGAVAAFGASMHARDKLQEFDTEVMSKTRATVTGKGGLGAAVADAGTGFMPLGGMGPGVASHMIEHSYELELLRAHPEKYGFANWMRRIGGRGNYSLGIGAAVGAAVGLSTYALMSDKKEPSHEKNGDWQSKVDSDKDQPRELG